MGQKKPKNHKTMSFDSSFKEDDKVNFILENIDRKIDSCKRNMEKVETAMQEATSTYMTNLNATNLRAEKDALFENYTHKNKDLKRKYHLYESKIKKLQKEKDHIQTSGKVNPMTYWMEKGSQKFSKLMDVRKDGSQASQDDIASPSPVEVLNLGDKDSTMVSIGDLRNHISNTYKCSSLQSNDSDSLNRNLFDSNVDATGKPSNMKLENEIGNTLMMILGIVENCSEKIDFMQKEFEKQEETINEKFASMKVELKEYVKEEIFKSEQEIYTNSEQALSKFANNFYMRLDKVESALNTLIEKEKRPESSSGQQLLVKLANIVVQILSTIVMTFSSFADTINKLDSRIQLFLLFFLMTYVFIQTVRPIFEVLFYNK